MLNDIRGLLERCPARKLGFVLAEPPGPRDGFRSAFRSDRKRAPDASWLPARADSSPIKEPS
jgi:hypothetical protein